MNCNDARQLLEANSDGELDLMRQVELEAHIRDCAACALEAKALAARKEALRDMIPRFAASPQFRKRVQSALRAEGSPARQAAGWSLWNLGGMAASLMLVLALGYSWGSMRARSDSLLGEAISDHVRSLQVGHLMDVVSTDQHTVKPWFIGKVDFSPPVFDLADIGFPLAGGRLEHIDGRPAVALVYRRRLHSINLFVWPTSAGKVPERLGDKDGYNTMSWSQDGLNYLAVSEISGAELAQFTGEYRSRAK
jgi:anti-sigma factor RsiW